MTSKQKSNTAIIIVVLLLLYFLFYYFVLRKKKEKCPDGRDIPDSGNCADNPVKTDAQGNTIVAEAPKADVNGCIQPSQYIANVFPLSLGMKGDLVKQVQIALNTSYGNSIVEDGYFGCLTLAAVMKAWQVSTIDQILFQQKVQGKVQLPLSL